jgi:type VI secretion system secreted protein Hcp
MASDVYLQIEGVKGESNDAGHVGWIEVDAVDWGVIQPTSSTATTAGGHTIGRAVFDAIRVTKTVDLASPKLMELVAQGKTIPKAKLEFFRRMVLARLSITRSR